MLNFRGGYTNPFFSSQGFHDNEIFFSNELAEVFFFQLSFGIFGRLSLLQIWI